MGRPSGGRWCAAGADRANGQVLERQEIRDPEGLGEVSKTATLGEEGGGPCAEGEMGKGGRTCWER